MVYLTYAYEPEIAAARDRADRRGWGPEDLRWVRARGARAGLKLAREVNSDTLETVNTDPAIIVNAGFAGAIDNSVQIGQVVIVERFLTDSDFSKQPEAVAFPQVAGSPAADWQSVRGVTVAEPVLDASRRAQLHQLTGASIVDMESFHLAQTAQSFGLDFICLKVISDRADEAAWDSTVGEAPRWSRILGEAIERLLVQLYDRIGPVRG